MDQSIISELETRLDDAARIKNYFLPEQDTYGEISDLIKLLRKELLESVAFSYDTHTKF